MKQMAKVSRISRRFHSGKVATTALIVIGVIVIVGGFIKLLYIGSSTPSGREVDASTLIAKDLKVFVCGKRSADPRIHVDPCGDRDVQFGAVRGLTTVIIYGVRQPEEHRLIEQRARKALAASELLTLELIFKEDWKSADSKILWSIHIDKEPSNGNR